MALYFFDNKIEFIIPNSEASVIAQHIGIKDRTVGAYYMSDNYNGVKEFLNNFNGKIYLDLLRTKITSEKIFNYIIEEDKAKLIKSNLVEQLTIINEIENMSNSLVEIDMPTVNENQKYLKFNRENNYVKMFQDLLIGDVTKIIVKRMNTDTYLVYGEVVDNFEYLIDINFGTIDSQIED